MDTTKQQTDLTSLLKLSERFERQVDYSLSEMANSIMRLTATTRKGIREHLDSTAKEITKLYPFSNHSSPESKVLLLIKEKGYTPYGVTIPNEKMYNLFYEDTRIRIAQHDLPSDFMNESEKVDREGVLNTLGKLDLVDNYTSGGDECKSGTRMAELTPLGKRLAEIIAETRDSMQPRLRQSSSGSD